MKFKFRSAKYEHLDADGLTKIAHSEISCSLSSKIFATSLKLVFKTATHLMRLILISASLLYVDIKRGFYA